jgi:meso-butanediol dehydrogenase / (S,S)-butanediol dehydrogenase / diacetyl reductase
MSVFRLDGKVAIITGAGGAIGAATARIFSSQGARILLVDVDFPAVETLAQQIGSNAVAYCADLSQVSNCSAAIEQAVRSFGQLHILVNNAGICPRIPFLESNEQDWERIVAINQKSMFFCSQAAAPHLKKTRGVIISLASFAGRAGAVVNASIYSGTKGAIIALTKALARELAPDVRANAVAPSSVDTPMIRGLPEERLAELVDSIPLKRLGNPEEVAATILYLAADECRYMTGATIDVNGGLMML